MTQASQQCTFFTAAVLFSPFAVHSACHEPRVPDPPSGRNGADGTVCGSEPLVPGSIQFAIAAPRLQPRRWTHLTQLRSLQKVPAAIHRQSANDLAHRDPARFICMPCRSYRPQYSHPAAACYKMPEHNRTFIRHLRLLFVLLRAPHFRGNVCVNSSGT